MNRNKEIYKNAISQIHPSEELKIAGVDISSPEFIEEAISMFEGTISEFREIYRK